MFEFGPALSMGIAMFLFRYVLNKVRHVKTNGALRYNAFILVLGLIAAFAASGLLYVLFFVNHQGQHKPILFMAICCAGTAGYFLMAYIFTHGRFSTNGIYFRSLIYGKRSYAWRHLAAVDYKQGSGVYLLTFSDGKIIRISVFLNGWAELAALLRQKGFID